MDRLLYIAMNGARETMRAQAVNTNNMANASTTGFQADLQAFRSLPVSGPGLPSRAYAVAEGAGIDFTPGNVIYTGRDLDVAVDGAGWLAIQAPDGNEAYTRAGDLRVNSLGLLTTGAGHPVMGEGGPVAVPPFEQLEIAADGTISIQPLGQAVNTLAVVDRIKLVNPPPGELAKGGDGLVRTANREPAVADSGVQLQTGAIESSNVSAVESMVKLIELARKFETQVKVMKSAEENDRAAVQLMRMG